MSAPAASDASSPKPKGKKMIVFGGAFVVLLAIAVAAWMLLGRGAADGDEDAAPARAAQSKPKPRHDAPPTFLPMETMVVNLADPGGEKFAQIGITVEVMDQKTADQIKAYLPTIRSAVLMLVSQRTSEELLSREGKQKLASDVRREVARPLGYEIEEEEPEDTDGKARRKARPPAFNPIYGVLFSSFIIQ